MLDPSLPLPPSWRRHAFQIPDVPSLWASLDEAGRAAGLQELWTGTGIRSQRTGLGDWTAWLKAGLPVDAPFPAGPEASAPRTTLLGHAMQSANGPLILTALDHGADPNPVQTVESSPGVVRSRSAANHMAAGSPHSSLIGTAIFKALLDRGWDPTRSLDETRSFLGECVASGWFERLERIARLKPDVDWNAPNKNGRPVLAVLLTDTHASSRWASMATWLMDHGADPHRLPPRDRLSFVVRVARWGDDSLTERVLALDLHPLPELRAALSALSAGPSTAETARALALLEARALHDLPVPESSPAGRLRL